MICPTDLSCHKNDTTISRTYALLALSDRAKIIFRRFECIASSYKQDEIARSQIALTTASIKLQYREEL